MEKLAANLCELMGNSRWKMLSEVLVALEEQWQAAFVSESLRTSATLAAIQRIDLFLICVF